MPVEGTNTIAGLNQATPVGGDPISDSDDYHRQIKDVLKNIFKGAGLQGFATPINATEAEINYLVGVTSLVQTQLNTLTTNVAARIKKDGSEEFTGTVGGVAAAVDTDFVRAQDYASTTLGGTLKARYDSPSNTLYLTNNGVNP